VSSYLDALGLDPELVEQASQGNKASHVQRTRGDRADQAVLPRSVQAKALPGQLLWHELFMEGNVTSSKIAAATLFAFGTIGFAANAAAVETPFVYAGKTTISKTVANVAIVIPVQIYVGADIGLQAPTIQVKAVADLGDLQRKISQLVAGANLPKNNCGSYSANNPVVSLTNTKLTFANGAAVFHTNGDVDVWDCRENPVPNSKVEWQMKGFGPLKTKVPVVSTWPGNPIKNKLGTQPFSIDIPVTLKRADGSTLAVDIGEAHADLGGQYSDITKDILRLVKVDVNQKLNDAIRNAVDPKALASQLPKDIVGTGIVLDDARFVALDAGGTLGAEAHASLKLTGKNAEAIGKLLYDEIKKKVSGQ
jgi:hypothetical protein